MSPSGFESVKRLHLQKAERFTQTELAVNLCVKFSLLRSSAARRLRLLLAPTPTTLHLQNEHQFVSSERASKAAVDVSFRTTASQTGAISRAFRFFVFLTTHTRGLANKQARLLS